MIKVLIAEDSPVISNYLEYVLNLDPEIQVVGIVRNGKEAVKWNEQQKPDVITMDIHMPGMDGFETTRRIMETNPVPIVICSANWNPDEVDKTFRTIEAGAVAAIEKPKGFGNLESDSCVKELVQTVKFMAEIKVIKRLNRHKQKIWKTRSTENVINKFPNAVQDIKLVVIGASTGGPIALQTILASLPLGFPVPIVAVQHITRGFLKGLSDWLTDSTGYPVCVASNGEVLKAGKCYFAPIGFQMAVDRNLRAVIKYQMVENGNCPSVSNLFRSVANALGNQSLGILLSGMGKDGAKELRMLREKGNITIAQNEESSVVHGMPGEAIKLDGATYILPCDKISEKLLGLIIK